MIIQFEGTGLTDGGLFKAEVVSSNVNYYALINSVDGVYATDFPAWAFVTREVNEVVTDSFILPVISLLMTDVIATITSYIGYCPKANLPLTIQIKHDCGFNPFVPASVADPVKALFSLP
ncbi:MAG: hypothetical protein AB1589_18645 [Cyanobacteriota bacterium]